MLTQKHVIVHCERDNKEKTFYYTEISSETPGLRYGCADKQTCPIASKCWLKIRKEIFKK